MSGEEMLIKRGFKTWFEVVNLYVEGSLKRLDAAKKPLMFNVFLYRLVGPRSIRESDLLASDPDGIAWQGDDTFSREVPSLLKQRGWVLPLGKTNRELIDGRYRAYPNNETLTFFEG